MSYALGDTVPLTTLTTDSAGDPANADTVVLTITLPDGSTSTPTVTNPPATTGTYTYTYTPTLAGHHGVRWVFTGANAQAPAIDSFYVDRSDLAPLVSLAEVREQCRAATTTDDARLLSYALIASRICEDLTKIYRRQTFSETFDGGVSYLQLRFPIISITSVTEDSTTLTSTDYLTNDERGWLYRGTQWETWPWYPGVQNIDVTYVAGASDGIVPDDIRQGVKLQVQHMWDFQRGGSGLPRQQGSDFSYDPRSGFTIPNAVMEYWQREMPGVYVA